MVNLNLWVSLPESEYQALMSVYGDEYAMKFAMNMAIRKLVKEKTDHLVITHIQCDESKDIA